MKIIMISNMYPNEKYPSYGVFVKNFEKELSKEGFKFEKSVIKGKSITKIDKIIKYFIFFLNTWKKILKNDYDLIYVHFAKHSLLPLFFIKPFIKKPIVINAHGDDIIKNNKLFSFFTKKIIEQSSLFIVPSEYFKQLVFKRYQHKSIFISPSGGINTKLFKPEEKSKNEEIFTLGFVSRIDEGKGWLTLLKSLCILQNNDIKCKLIIIGNGKEMNILKLKIKEFDLKNVFVHGEIKQDQLPIYFNQMDLFIFPSERKSESLGLVGIEALSCGVPVIGSNIGGIPSYIQNNYNGILFEPGNEIELTKHINYFMNLEANEYELYRSNARTKALEYDSKIVTKVLADKLNLLLEKQTKR